jgi:thiamine biosynthesis lipoprotein
MKKIFTLLFLIKSFSSFHAQEYLQINGATQGTTFHIAYQDPKERDFSKKIFQLLAEFDASVSTYNPQSIITKVNQNQVGVKLDPYFITCFEQAKIIWDMTEGAFDPTVYPLVNAWGFGPERKSVLEQQKIDSLLAFVGFDKIEIVNGQIQKKDPRVQLDFNAFAQGYSVDVLANFLLKKGVQNFIVEIGGEVYAHGKAENGKWRVGIEQPVENKTTKNELQIIVELQELAVATSGNYRRFKEVDGKKIVHHLDPKTGKPTANNLLSASVFSAHAIQSDALATGFLVLGLEKSKEFLKQHPEIQVFFIYADDQGKYRVFITDQLMEWIAQEQ